MISRKTNGRPHFKTSRGPNALSVGDDPRKYVSPLCRLKIANLLRGGFGVEDIAVKTKIDPDAIRSEVRRLRKAKQLLDILNG